MKISSSHVLYKKLENDIEKLRAPEGYLWAGLPRFRRLFGRDSLISAWQLLDINSKIAKNTLYALATQQGKVVNLLKEEEPGKILHECPVTLLDLISLSIKKKFRWHFPYYGSVDSTAWFLILFGKYIEKTQDIAFVLEFWPNILRALEWIEKYGDIDSDELIEYERKNPSGLLHQGWKDGGGMKVVKIVPPVAIVEAQGYYYLALKSLADLAEKVVGDFKLAAHLEHKAHLLKKNFLDFFWMPDKKYFAFALDGQKRQIKMITSNPGHLLFTGILDREHTDYVVQRLFASDLWTPYGIRTHSTNDSLFDPRSYHRGSVWPHDNWIIYQGLKTCGYIKEAEMVRHALIRVLEELGYIPELYAVEKDKIYTLRKACKIQAWSSGALLQLLFT